MTRSELKRLLIYNPCSGMFFWSIRRQGVRPFRRAGTVNQRGYRYIMIDRVQYFEHRLAWLYTYGEWPKEEIDHIDGRGGNNSIWNLRDVTRSENMKHSYNLRRESKNGQS